jgi:glycosyltransferase involved in cell wall biosynthesis
METLAGAILAACLALTVAFPRLLRGFSVPEPGPDEGTASISVVVAAHDEAPRIGSLIASLLEQDHPDFQVIVVDDRSADGTADAARAAAAGDPRFEVLTVEERPGGWQGRLYAQGVGAQAARGKWILCLSGDQELRSRSFLRAMVAEYERSSASATSVVGPFTGRRWWHRWWFHPIMNAPIVWGPIFAVQKLRPDSPWLIGALGLRRDLWREIGGARAAATCAAGGFDDWGWCEVFRRRRERARTVYHPALADSSNWTDFRTFFQGFTRWLVGVFTYRKGGWIVGGLLLLLIGWMLTDQARAAVSLWRGQGASATSVMILATALTIGVGYRQWSGERWWFALVYHLVGLLFVISFLGAIWARIRNRVGWRDDVMTVVTSPPTGMEKDTAAAAR